MFKSDSCNNASLMFWKLPDTDSVKKPKYYLHFLNRGEVLHTRVRDAAEFSEVHLSTDCETMLLVRQLFHSCGLELLCPIDKMHE